MMKDNFCNYCGDRLYQDKYPMKCMCCKKEIYNNPLPVSVSAIFISTGTSKFKFKNYGILVVKRNIEPKKNEWAFPGGYLEQGETWQEGAAREVLEEVGLSLIPDEFKLLTVETATNGNLLVFNFYKKLISFKEIDFKPNNEVSEIKFISVSEELAFPTHTSKIPILLEMLPTIIRRGY